MQRLGIKEGIIRKIESFKNEIYNILLKRDKSKTGIGGLRERRWEHKVKEGICEGQLNKSKLKIFYLNLLV